MSNIPISGRDALDTLLAALADQLAARRAGYTLAVAGGSALLALGLVTRATSDVDVLAVVSDGQLMSAEPLPTRLREAADTVARDFSLPPGWLNSGPTSLLDFGLPEGFVGRAERRRYGPALEVLFAARLDQIHFKLYATVDQGPGRHLEDLKNLAPTPHELRAAARWSEQHDPSEATANRCAQSSTIWV